MYGGGTTEAGAMICPADAIRDAKNDCSVLMSMYAATRDKAMSPMRRRCLCDVPDTPLGGSAFAFSLVLVLWCDRVRGGERTVRRLLVRAGLAVDGAAPDAIFVSFPLIDFSTALEPEHHQVFVFTLCAHS